LLPNLTVEKVTTVDRVAQVMRAEILGGRIAPGTPLREVEIASSAGVSRGSVRQAFSILINEGLLSRDSYRSVVVTTLTEQDIREIFQARRMIELAAVEATALATEEQVAVLRRACAEFIAAVEAGDPDRSHQADVDVHTALVGLLGSGRLSRVHSELMGELRLALTAQYHSPPDGPTLMQRHRDFIELIATGRTEEARTQLSTRLDIAEKRLLGAFRDAHPR
jgi:DNA-binding GntR family transcriptional regulator